MNEFFIGIIENIKRINDSRVSQNLVESLRTSVKIEYEEPEKVISAERLKLIYGLSYYMLRDYKVVADRNQAQEFLQFYGMDKSLPVIRKILNARNYSQTFKRDPILFKGQYIFTYAEVLILSDFNVQINI